MTSQPPLKGGPRLAQVGESRETRADPAREAAGATSAIVVAGMHRSGTSAITRALALCGLELPRRLIRADKSNERGYWESEPVTACNEALLAEIGSAWDDAAASHPRVGGHDRAAVESIKAALTREFSLDRDFVIKDPRISILAAPWRAAIDELGLEARFIIMVRNPLEVAESLRRRDAFPTEKSTLVWLAHLLAAERDSRGAPRVFVSYDDLLQDWRRCFARIESALDIRLPAWNDAAAAEIDAFLSPEQRHHAADRSALDRRSDLPPWIAPAYEWALDAASTDGEPDPTKLELIGEAYHEPARVFAPLLSFERSRATKPDAPSSRFNVRIYSATKTEHISEATSVSASIDLTETPQTFRLTTPMRDAPIIGLRVDPSEGPGLFILHALRIRGAGGVVFWEWRVDSDLFDVRKGIAAQAIGDGTALLEFFDNDPRADLPLNGTLGNSQQVTVELVASIPSEAVVAEARYQRLRELFESVRGLQGQLVSAAKTAAEVDDAARAAAKEARAMLAEVEAAGRAALAEAVAAAEVRAMQIASSLGLKLSEQRRAAEARQRTQNEQLNRASALAVEREQERDEARATAAERQRQIDAIKASTSWRLTAPVRVARNIMARLARSLLGAARRARGAVRSRTSAKTYASASASMIDGARIIARSNWFDPDWYRANYSDIREAKLDPLAHYLHHGGGEGRRPGPAFDSRWYLGQNPDVAAANLNPLVHFLVAGRREGRTPSATAPKALRLGVHLRLLRTDRHRAHLVANALLAFDPILPRRLARRLRAKAHETAPKQEAIARPVSTAATAALQTMFDTAGARGDEYVPLTPKPIAQPPRVRTIAFYLPQFHPIPENDAWWGKGFTEWTNVSKAVPQYVGHYQPRLPDELGFYDLRVPEVQRRQIELAKHFGIHGFCFHYYWFTGRKRLLERPLNQFLDATDIDFPFCICWANENWTRRWDGMDQEILMEQKHAPEDALQFIEDLAPALADPRYIKVDGRPLIIVYRASLLPDAKRTVQVWREFCASRGLGDPYLVAAQSFGLKDPRPFGFDAAVEFPPHNIASGEVTSAQSYLNDKFEGRVFSYEDIATRGGDIVWPEYTLFKTIMPAWDNEARKPGKGHSFAGSTPATYKRWFDAACHATNKRYQRADERLVFVNAWNEWAEGAYLEPDRRFGYGYLQATREVLEQISSPDVHATKGIAIVSHDAFPAGAQQLSLHLARALQSIGHRVEFVLLGDGALAAEFRSVARVHWLAGENPNGEAARRVARTLRENGIRGAIANTTASGRFVETLKDAGLRVVSLVHELPGILRDYKLEPDARVIATRSDAVVFAADRVRDGFEGFAGRKLNNAVIRPQGLYLNTGSADEAGKGDVRAKLRERLGLPEDALIVLGVGYADERKGIDLFLDVAAAVCAQRADAHFVWAGEIKGDLAQLIAQRVAAGEAGRTHLPGRIPIEDMPEFYQGADLLLLTSREDPFPSVILEALNAGAPVVAFENAGGFEALLRSGAGVLAPHGDSGAMAAHVLALLADPSRCASLGDTGRARVRADFSFRRYAFDVAAMTDRSLQRVSVITPNFNYARYLEERIGSIAGQTAPIYEIIGLDDASTDDSAAVLRTLLDQAAIDSDLMLSTENSGSACKQWLRGVMRARGDLVWIAEADDLSDPAFVETLLPAFDDPAVVMAYCQSQQMNAAGAITGADYLDYVADLGRDRWLGAHVVDGREELRTALSVKNAIPNVSACLFRRDALLKALSENIEEIARYRVAGDWATYAHVLTQGKLAFVPRALNKHRRHERSVTIGSFDANLLREILSMQQTVRQRHNPSPDWQVRARAYAQELYTQFGLARPTAPEVTANPDFRPFFS
jgi:glycosyltransferase involved in cell wall biosynthesis